MDKYEERLDKEYKVNTSVNNHAVQVCKICTENGKAEYLWLVEHGMPRTLFDSLGCIEFGSKGGVFKNRYMMDSSSKAILEREVTVNSQIGNKCFVNYVPGRPLHESIALRYPDGNVPFEELCVLNGLVNGKYSKLFWSKELGDDPNNDDAEFQFSHGSHFVKNVVVLSEEQTKVKLADLFENKILVIDGGPGTGKSATMMQRLKMFLDPDFYDVDTSIASDFLKNIPKHIDAQYVKNQIIDKGHWAYFTPTTQLKDFLRNALRQQNDKGYEKYIDRWYDFCNKGSLMDDYGVPPDCPKDGKLVEKVDPVKEYEKFKSILNRNFIVEYNQLVKTFENERKNCSSFLTQDTFPCINFASSLSDSLGVCKTIQSIYESSEGCDALDLYVMTENKENLFNALCDLLENWLDCDERGSIERTYFMYVIKKIVDDDSFPKCNFSETRSLLKRNKAVLALDLLAKKSSVIENRINPSIESSHPARNFQRKSILLRERRTVFGAQYKKEIENLNSDFAVFEKNRGRWESCLVGDDEKDCMSIGFPLLLKNEKISDLDENLVSVFIKELYSAILKDSSFNFDIEPIKILAIEEKINEFLQPLRNLNSALRCLSYKSVAQMVYKYFPDSYREYRACYQLGAEAKMPFWIYANNTIAKTFLSSGMTEKECEGIKGLEAYLKNRKFVICVDEATDYSPMDYAAILSLSHNEVSVITLCGDLMQNFKLDGVQHWNDLEHLAEDKTIDVRELTVSYRQTATLLNLAKNMYKRVKGVLPNYSPVLQKGENEPLPLLKTSDSDDEKINWIVEQIQTIRTKNNGELPAVAIFYPSKSLAEVLKFAKKVNEVANGLFKVKTSATTEDDKVIVYSLVDVKGLEFEAAFFYDIDQCIDQDLQQKYLYVGLTRATRYLAATSSVHGYSLAKGIAEEFTDASKSNW